MTLMSNLEKKTTQAAFIFAWILLAASSALLIFQTTLSSDSLFLDDVMTDIFQHDGKWNNWKMTAAPAYLPDMLVYAASYFIFESPAQRIVFTSMIQAVLLAWACIRLAISIRPSLSTYSKILTLAVLSFVVLAAANSSMWLFFNSTNNHFAALLFPILCISSIFDYYDKKRISSAVLFFFCVTAGTISTPIFILSFTTPLIVLIVFFFVLTRNNRGSTVFLIKITTLTLAGHFFASAISAATTSFDALSGRTSMTPEAIIRAAESFIRATIFTLRPDNIYTFALSMAFIVSICAVITDYLFKLKISQDSCERSSAIIITTTSSNDNWRHLVCLLFFLTSLPLSVIGSITSGGFVDVWGYRYFTLPLALGLLLWIVTLDTKPAFNKPYTAYLLVTLLLFIGGLGIISTRNLLLESGRKTYTELFDAGTFNSADEVSRCIDKEARSGFIFKKGAADYWYARAVTYKTQKPSYILPITNDLNPFFHMMSLSPLIAPTQNGDDLYNFLVLRKNGTVSQFNLKPEAISQTLPNPDKIVSCLNSDAELWLYGGSALDDQLRKRTYRLLSDLGQLSNFSISASELPGQVGSVNPGERFASEPNDNAGFLSYGPYFNLPTGHYQVTIFYSATESGNKWDAGRFNDPARQIPVAAGDIPTGEGNLRFEFELTSPIKFFEIRIWFGGRGGMKLNRIELHQKATTNRGAR